MSFNFDLTPVSIPVTIGGESYILSEASEAAAIVWRNANLGAAKLKDGKPVSFSGMADSAPLLVSLCIKRQETDGTLSAVSADTVKRWPARIVKPLYQWIKDHSELSDRDDQKALERRFIDTGKSLMALSESGRDRAAWSAWMSALIIDSFEETESTGPNPVKNG